MSVWVYIYLVCADVHRSAYGGQKRMADPPGAEVAGNVGSGNQTSISYKSSKHF